MHLDGSRALRFLGPLLTWTIGVKLLQFISDCNRSESIKIASSEAVLSSLAGPFIPSQFTGSNIGSVTKIILMRERSKRNECCVFKAGTQQRASDALLRVPTRCECVFVCVCVCVYVYRIKIFRLIDQRAKL